MYCTFKADAVLNKIHTYIKSSVVVGMSTHFRRKSCIVFVIQLVCSWVDKTGKTDRGKETPFYLSLEDHVFIRKVFCERAIYISEHKEKCKENPCRSAFLTQF